MIGRVVRIVDDQVVGAFASSPCFRVLSARIEPVLLREIAWAAIRAAKTSWVGRLHTPDD